FETDTIAATRCLKNEKEPLRLKTKPSPNTWQGSLAGVPPIYNNFHDRLDLSLGVMEVAGNPEQGMTTYATIGLWQTAIPHGDKEFPARLDLLGAFPSDLSDARQLVAAPAFSIM